MLKHKSRPPARVVVSPATEWTDYHGVLELFGLRRSTAYYLSEQGLIKSVSLRNDQEVRGKRLFNVASIRKLIADREKVAAKRKGGAR
jgi:hypothetical protein